MSLDSVTSEAIPFDELSEEQKNYFLKGTETIRTYDVDGNLKQERITPIPEPEDIRKIAEIENDKYFRYKVYNYCELPNEIIEPLVEAGMSGAYGIGLLDQQSDLADLMNLQRSYGQNSYQRSFVSDQELAEQTNQSNID